MRIALDVFMLLMNPPSKLRPNFQTSWRGPVIIHFITILLWRGHLDEAVCQGWYTSSHNNLSTFPNLNQQWKRIFTCQPLLVDNYFLLAACVSGFSWHLRIKMILRGKTSPFLSSPRAESARAFTGRRNSYRGRGEDFLSRQPNFFTETAVTPERKVEKWFPRWEINRHAEG